MTRLIRSNLPGPGEAEAQVHDGLDFFRRRLPGFKNIELVDMAITLGVQQSYQIVGQHP